MHGRTILERDARCDDDDDDRDERGREGEIARAEKKDHVIRVRPLGIDGTHGVRDPECSVENEWFSTFFRIPSGKRVSR